MFIDIVQRVFRKCYGVCKKSVQKMYFQKNIHHVLEKGSCTWERSHVCVGKMFYLALKVYIMYWEKVDMC